MNEVNSLQSATDALFFVEFVCLVFFFFSIYESTFVHKASMWDQTPAKNPRRRMWEEGHQFAVLEDILYYQQVGFIYVPEPEEHTPIDFLLFVLLSAIAHEEVSPEPQSNSISSGGDGGISGRCHCESDGKALVAAALAVVLFFIAILMMLKSPTILAKSSHEGSEAGQRGCISKSRIYGTQFHHYGNLGAWSRACLYIINNPITYYSLKLF
ncbi:hypothetical protein F0562_007396 [Nyssa sinensis]|uniref:Uncharacterized protein n=1 Tax=Nyssa sinensis TaxID=561372 RepID=A0A5J5A7Z8_9ASTE|nr:hypothetical protein F0562_007396 [Nyssa sinensis]